MAKVQNCSEFGLGKGLRRGGALRRRTVAIWVHARQGGRVIVSTTGRIIRRCCRRRRRLIIRRGRRGCRGGIGMGRVGHIRRQGRAKWGHIRRRICLVDGLYTAGRCRIRIRGAVCRLRLHIADTGGWCEAIHPRLERGNGRIVTLSIEIAIETADTRFPGQAR